MPSSLRAAPAAAARPFTRAIDAARALKASGADLFLAPDRCYGTFEEMIRSEAALPADQRMDFIAIVTPKAVAPVVLWLFGVVWLFWLRVALLYIFLFFGLVPKAS